MSDSTVKAILILFHNSGYRRLKHFYLDYECQSMGHLFPRALSYNRFVELQKRAVIKLAVLVKTILLGKYSAGWFFGFKLHIICNEMGVIVYFMFTSGNVDDRDPLKVERFAEDLYGKSPTGAASVRPILQTLRQWHPFSQVSFHPHYTVSYYGE